jgi:xanthine dehydrogenase accessory factor
LKGRAKFILTLRVESTFSELSVLGLQESQTEALPLTMGTIAQNDLYRLIGEANARGERVVVATVAHTRGSTPQRRGAKMLFFENGQTAGTVGGGCVEAEVWAEAREALRQGEPGLHHFALTADEASEEGMVCGGTMDIFIDVWENS